MDANVDDMIKAIPRFFLPERAGGRRLIVAYQIMRKDGGTSRWTVHVENGRCFVSAGIEEGFTTKLIAGEEDYLRMVRGRGDYASMRYCGRIRLIGNTLGHRELNFFLDPSRPGGWFYL
jgi:hypothetical protein